jgi:phosphoribosylformylglycinamidine synthase
LLKIIGVFKQKQKSAGRRKAKNNNIAFTKWELLMKRTLECNFNDFNIPQLRDICLKLLSYLTKTNKERKNQARFDNYTNQALNYTFPTFTGKNL